MATRVRVLKSYLDLCDEVTGTKLSMPYWIGKEIYDGTQCGAWTSFLLNNVSTTHYYGDALEMPLEHFKKAVIGISIGTIVEGTSAEVGPYKLFFPFTVKELWETVDRVEAEADVIWRQANQNNE